MGSTDYAGPNDPRMFEVNGDVFVSFNTQFFDANQIFIDSMVSARCQLKTIPKTWYS